MSRQFIDREHQAVQHIIEDMAKQVEKEKQQTIRHLYHDWGKPLNDVQIKGKKIMANVWGGQTEVTLTTWSEIRRMGFKKRERAFGDLNDGTPALYFMAYDEQKNNHWFLTTEKLEELED